MAFSLIYEAKTQKCDGNCKKTHAFFKSIIDVNNISCNKCYLFKSDDVMLAPNTNVMIEKRQKNLLFIEYKMQMEIRRN